MTRSKHFQSPIHERLLRAETTASGPLPFLNPTRARFSLPDGAASLQPSDPDFSTAPGSAAQLEWRTRDNRKGSYGFTYSICQDSDVLAGRHVLVVPRHHQKSDSPQLTNTWSAVGHGVWRMLTVCAWWDVSWWIAVLFSVGSAIFVICSFWYWLPLAAPSTAFPHESLIGGGVTAAVGATLFEIGGLLLIVEASNENQVGCFGWATEQLIHPDSHAEKEGSKSVVHSQECFHHHASGLHRSIHLQHPDSGRKWEWWPTWQELKTHYVYELGFWASSVEALGATIFWISGIMALPGIINNISTPILWGTYWLAYLVGGIIFIVASVGYMLEPQEKWWKPAPSEIGWWIGVWNLIGSIGWTLSAAFGYCTRSWCEYQSDLSLLWASVAFLVGSLLLWYEALDKYPVKRDTKS